MQQWGGIAYRSQPQASMLSMQGTSLAGRACLSVREMGLDSLQKPVSGWDPFVAGYQPYRKAHLSMHQMGSCRQGASPQDSVTDGEGQCWDVADLYVADASAFPTATGMQAPDTSANCTSMLQPQSLPTPAGRFCDAQQIGIFRACPSVCCQASAAIPNSDGVKSLFSLSVC